MAPTVRVRRDSEGRWWWTFVDGALEIGSNHPYTSRRAAEEGARTAYPDVPVVGEEVAQPAPRERAGLLACALMTLAIWRHYRPAGGRSITSEPPRAARPKAGSRAS